MTGQEFKDRMHQIFACYDGRRIMQSMDGGFKGMTPIMIELKKAKENNKEVNAGDLAEKFDVSTARVATIINTLEDKGFIIRKKSERDGRLTIVELTNAGEDEIVRIDKISTDLIGKGIDGISDSDLEIFFKVLYEFTLNINKL